MKEKIKKRILPTLLIACALPLILFLSTPFDIFAGNYNEFVFSFTNFFGVCFGYFIVSTAICFLILLFLPEKGYKIVAGLLLGFALMMFIQSNMLNGTLSTLGGDGEGSIIPTYLIVIDTIIWIVVLAAFVGVAFVPSKKLKWTTASVIVACVVVITQVFTPAITAITKREMFLTFQQRMEKQDDEYTHMILTNKNLTTAGKEGNIYVFCIDKFDEQWTEDCYATAPEEFDILKGFTWFQDHISRYGHTYPSIINMLTETPYFAAEATSRTKFLDEAYNNANGLKTLQAEGWKINIFSEKFYTYNDAYYLPDYIQNKAEAKNYKVANSALLGLNMVELGLYRTMPFVIKNLMNNLSSDLFNNSIEESDQQGNVGFQPGNEKVDKFTSQSQFELVDGKGFYFIHINGLHNAYKDYKRLPALKLSFKIVNKYLSFLKESGLFENSTIILLGDHGNGTPYNKTPLKNSVRTALFVKPAGIGEQEMKISQAQTSHVQLWTTILEQAKVNGGEDFGMSFLETPEDEDIQREFTWHTYNCKLIEYNYVVLGDAENFDNWVLKNKTSYNRKITD